MNKCQYIEIYSFAVIFLFYFIFLVSLVQNKKKKTNSTITMLFQNTKAMIHSLDGDTDFFDPVAGVLEGDILALNLFKICQDNGLRTSRK